MWILPAVRALGLERLLRQLGHELDRFLAVISESSNGRSVPRGGEAVTAGSRGRLKFSDFRSNHRACLPGHRCRCVLCRVSIRAQSHPRQSSRSKKLLVGSFRRAQANLTNRRAGLSESCRPGPTNLRPELALTWHLGWLYLLPVRGLLRDSARLPNLEGRPDRRPSQLRPGRSAHV